MIENIAQIDILKIKLTFFVSLGGGSFYMLINMYKFIEKLEFGLIIVGILSLALMYAFIGVFINLRELNKKYKEIECLRNC